MWQRAVPRPPVMQVLHRGGLGCGPTFGTGYNKPVPQHQPDASVVEVAAGGPLLAAVTTLADRHRDKLGFLPAGVFKQRAAAGHVLAAVNSEHTLLGYAVFDLARGRVRLVQLCVAPRLRRAGVARLLVDEISRRHQDLPGIRVTCRADYVAAKVWPRLDFTLMGEQPGRGHDAKPLEIWWRSHGVPDLFSTLVDDDQALLVALDHNVFIDLAVATDRSGALESQVLASEWLASRLTLAVTLETLNELQGLPVGARGKQRAAATGFKMLEGTREQLAVARRELAVSLDSGAVGEADLRHVLHAAAGGARVLVTRDEALIEAAGDAAQARLGLRIMRPSDVALHIDELEHAERYRPAALRGTGFHLQDTPAGSQSVLADLLSKATGERRADYAARLRQLLSTPGLEHQHVRDGQGRLVLAWTLDSRTNVWTLPLLRSSRLPLAATVQRLLTFDLKRRAVAAGATELRVTDPHCGATVVASLQEDGFALVDGTHYGVLLLDARSLAAALALLPQDHDLHASLSATGLSPEQLARVEQRLWPAKLLDGALANYIVSIQPRWANELFSLQDTLLERPSLLGLSREHVYFRSPGGNPTAPSRLLWYASGTGPRGIGAVVATSQLVEVLTDTPPRLYRRFAHLGVYRLEDVAARAKNGVASALRFVDTERFVNQVPLEKLRSLGVIGQRAVLLSPLRVGASEYGVVYRTGTGRSGR